MDINIESYAQIIRRLIDTDVSDENIIQFNQVMYSCGICSYEN